VTNTHLPQESPFALRRAAGFERGAAADRNQVSEQLGGAAMNYVTRYNDLTSIVYAALK
jgi:hypothetical protein